MDLFYFFSFSYLFPGARHDGQELVFGAERGLKWAALGGQIGRDTAGLLRKTGVEEKHRRKEKKRIEGRGIERDQGESSEGKTE